MPPKATNVEVSEASFKFIFSVLKHCDDIRPNWNAVATENGISYARNASARFKDVVKRLGFKFENGKIIDLNDDGDADDTPAAPKTPKNSRAKKGTIGVNMPALKSKGKKRKAHEIETDEDNATEDDGDVMKKEESNESADEDGAGEED